LIRPVHSGCWASASRVRKLDGGTTTTLARWHQVHDLLDAGVGLGECARRLNLALNTVKRYARIDKPERIRRAPQYRPTLVDPLPRSPAKRRAEDPAVPVLQPLSYHRKSDRAERWTDPGRDQPRSGGSSLGTLLLEVELILADPGLDGLLAF
jgi:hypothetical protein